MLLQSFNDFMKAVKSSNSSNDKLKVLECFKNDEYIKNILIYTYNPFYMYYVTPERVKKAKITDEKSDIMDYYNIFALLDSLRNREITGYQAISNIRHFLSAFPECEELLNLILDKDLGCGIAVKTINKVFNNLIPVFDVALANTLNKIAKKPDFEKEVWFASSKKDGVRCITIKDKNTVKCISRTGIPFDSLQKIKEEVLKIPMESFVLDGEIVILDENEKEDFQRIMKEIRKKNHTIQNPTYMIFDFLSLDEFFYMKSINTLSHRYDILKEKIANVDNTVIKMLPQLKVKSEEHLQYLLKRAKELNWEGLIVRKDIFYENGRTNNMIKYKFFEDAEFVVVGIKEKVKNMLVDENDVPLCLFPKDQVRIKKEKSKMKDITCMGTAIIMLNEKEVEVGTGWSDEQCVSFYKNPNLIIGKTITVQFQNITNPEGKKSSLRIPSVKCIHGEQRDV